MTSERVYLGSSKYVCKYLHLICVVFWEVYSILINLKVTFTFCQLIPSQLPEIYADTVSFVFQEVLVRN